MYKQDQRLPNGAVVIASAKRVILASWRSETVVWSVDALGALHSGEYFASGQDAMRRFTRRVSTSL